MTVVCQIFNDTSIFVCTDCLIRGVNSVNMFSSLEGCITCANFEVMTAVIKFYDNDYYKWCKDHCVLLNNDDSHIQLSTFSQKNEGGYHYNRKNSLWCVDGSVLTDDAWICSNQFHSLILSLLHEPTSRYTAPKLLALLQVVIQF